MLEREAQRLSSRYVVVRRDIVWRSPIMLTPFSTTARSTPNAWARSSIRCYRDAGTTRDAIDSGAVILTGEAIKKTNATAIDELFAEEAGKFVCATAGHQLEAHARRARFGRRRASRAIATSACCTSTSAAARPSWR